MLYLYPKCVCHSISKLLLFGLIFCCNDLVNIGQDCRSSFVFEVLILFIFILIIIHFILVLVLFAFFIIAAALFKLYNLFPCTFILLSRNSILFIFFLDLLLHQLLYFSHELIIFLLDEVKGNSILVRDAKYRFVKVGL